MGYNITKTNLKPRHVLDLMDKRVNLPSESDITRADDIELQEFAEKVLKSMEDLISHINNQSQTDDLFEYPLRDLSGLDKQLRSIRGSLKVEVAKKAELKECIKKEHRKLKEFQEHHRVYGDDQCEEVENRIKRLSDELATRQESINLLKGKLKNQITSFKETIAEVLDKDTSMAEKIRTLFREQRITIASIFTASGMAIGGGAMASGGPPKDEKGLKK